jgi:hypothetical protein
LVAVEEMFDDETACTARIVDYGRQRPQLRGHVEE